jgi:cell division protein FtsW
MTARRPGPPPLAFRRPARADGILVLVVAGLLAVGLLLTFTASYTPGYRVSGDAVHYFKRQVAWILLGLVAAGVVYGVDYRFWRRFSVPIMGATLVGLVLTLKLGHAENGSVRWLGDGSIQPSELAKLAVVLYMADWMASKREAVRDALYGLVPFSIIIGLVSGLVFLQPNFSTAVLIGAVAVAMFFTAGADMRQMLVAGAFAFAGLALIVLESPYRLRRVLAFLDPGADPQGAGFQVRVAMQAFSAGGLLGVGLGAGQTKLVLPVAWSDAVFSVLGEETGLLGCLVVLVLFAVFAWRGLRVAAGAPDRYGTLLATGITVWILAQTVISVAVVSGFAPPTGIPLPFLSYGGSSMVTCLTAVGLLLNISTHMDDHQARVYANLGLRWRNRRARLSRSRRDRSRRG